MDVGWICPRCGKVNAPWKPTCDCTGESSAGANMCEHKWELVETSGGIKIICTKCGAQKGIIDPSFMKTWTEVTPR